MKSDAEIMAELIGEEQREPDSITECIADMSEDEVQNLLSILADEPEAAGVIIHRRWLDYCRTRAINRFDDRYWSERAKEGETT